ncbi:MAG TPA: TonB-dependent receptor [Planctomycetota bacterium]|nr:TonB-dependent receptor [Planctomycetota bacterium]
MILMGAMLHFGAPMHAQQPPGSIRGVVYDKDFDAPLAGAQVRAVETGQQVATTDQGHFVFPQVPPGKYTLVFSKEGYVRQVKADVQVSSGQLTDVDVYLAGEFTEMEEFVVQDILPLAAGTEAALLQLRLESPALLDSISADLMSRAGASDAASALRLVSGASVQDGKYAVIRGLPDRYVSSQMNGVRLPTADEDKRAVELDQFPAPVIESIQVSKTFTPDQQGDASGGAVNLRLKGIPDETILQLKSGVRHNSQATGRSDFLTYDGGGVSFWGRDDGGRDMQNQNIGGNWDGAVGVSRSDAPVDSKFSGTVGGKRDLGNGITVGGFVGMFYERESSFFDNGIDDSRWVETPGARMVPQTVQGTPAQGDFKTALFDVTQGKQSVKWGTLGAIGVQTENHSLALGYLSTRIAEDTATLAEDTRGKRHFFPGYDPDDPRTPGHDQPDAAPYVRLETLDYVERTTETLQLNGRHKLPIDGFGIFRAPELDWTLAQSSADLDEPDKRQFGSLWFPERQVGPILIPATHRPFKPSANFNLGNLQRIWKEIGEESDQVFANVKLPFEGWTGDEGYLKFGVFRDKVDRTFDQNTFSNFNDNSSFAGDFRDFWSAHFPSEDHPITASLFDVDYKGNQKISAWYGMIDLPLAAPLKVIAGARFESTEIGIVNDPEPDATWFPPGATAPVHLNPGDADVTFEQRDVLPSIGLELRPFKPVTLRAAYNETIARQTFKELTPILQQEFLGGPIFIGNPDLGMSKLKNYDVRLDVAPYEGGLLSASWFKKDIRNPIEYVQRVSSFTYTTPVNYPKGELTGWELEARQTIGRFWTPLEGLSAGANATFIDSEVTLPEDEVAGLKLPGIQAPMRTREMTNAPERLYNLYLTYDLPATGTQAALFYTVQGDTLVAGAGQSNGNFVPNIFAREYATLNLSVAQKLGKVLKLQVQGKNLTNPRIETVYRSDHIGDDVTRSSFTRGIETSISLSAEFRF